MEAERGGLQREIGRRRPRVVNPIWIRGLVMSEVLAGRRQNQHRSTLRPSLVELDQAVEDLLIRGIPAVAHKESPGLLVVRRRRPARGLENLLQVLGGDRFVGKSTRAPARQNLFDHARRSRRMLHLFNVFGSVRQDGTPREDSLCPLRFQPTGVGRSDLGRILHISHINSQELHQNCALLPALKARVACDQGPVAKGAPAAWAILARREMLPVATIAASANSPQANSRN